jgi:UPF0755 protein
VKNRPLLISGLIILFLFGAVYTIFWMPNTFDGDRFVTVSKGENFYQVLDSLADAGVIRSRLLFDMAGRLLGLTTRMQIGKYRFRSGMSNTEILDDIRYGKSVELIAVTIPEGLRPERQAQIFATRIGIDSARYVTLAYDSAFARTVGVPSQSLMGYLMPMTYKFYWQTDEEDILKTLVGEFWKVFDDTLRSDAASRGLSINEVLAMASIIEFETAIDSERPMIAGVYYNRLKKGMRLQADPTIQYLLETAPRRLHYRDLYRKSKYNTYRHLGLPPGPINNPGRASILAALHPRTHKYLFFVANGLGGHTFTRTYAEHLRAVRKYRKYVEQKRAAAHLGG